MQPMQQALCDLCRDICIRHAEALMRVSAHLNGQRNLADVLQTVCDETARTLGVSIASIQLYDPAEDVLRMAAVASLPSNSLHQAVPTRRAEYTGYVNQSGPVIMVSDLQTTPFSPPPHAAWHVQQGARSFVSVQMYQGDDLLGTLTVATTRSVRSFTSDDLMLLQGMAGQAALAITNAHLFAELVQSYDATLEGWARALDIRDKETESHTRRVTEMTMQLAHMLLVPDAILPHIRRGALLHDIGKLGVPDAILHKPGPLTNDEWVLMRQHPVYAYNMLKPITFLQPALDIPYCHHEKWDGTGYPRGLRQEEIPLAARIFAVVDVWDALRSDRPYRSAWSPDRTRAYILDQQGKHFDPDVVEPFLDRF